MRNSYFDRPRGAGRSRHFLIVGIDAPAYKLAYLFGAPFATVSTSALGSAEASRRRPGNRGLFVEIVCFEVCYRPYAALGGAVFASSRVVSHINAACDPLLATFGAKLMPAIPDPSIDSRIQMCFFLVLGRCKFI